MFPAPSEIYVFCFISALAELPGAQCHRKRTRPPIIWFDTLKLFTDPFFVCFPASPNNFYPSLRWLCQHLVHQSMGSWMCVWQMGMVPRSLKIFWHNFDSKTYICLCSGDKATWYWIPTVYLVPSLLLLPPLIISKKRAKFPFIDKKG